MPCHEPNPACESAWERVPTAIIKQQRPSVPTGAKGGRITYEGGHSQTLALFWFPNDVEHFPFYIRSELSIRSLQFLNSILPGLHGGAGALLKGELWG